VTQSLDRAEGERRRDVSLALLAESRAGQLALLTQMLDTRTATADDVRAAVPLPEGIGRRCYDTVPMLASSAPPAIGGQHTHWPMLALSQFGRSLSALQRWPGSPIVH
jgi:hypothetical protein